MHVLLVNNLYPPINAGGAELVVAYLAEGLVARGHRATVVSTCGPDMEPYPAETRNGVEVVRFFPRNMYWSFTREGHGKISHALWHLRDAWNRDAARRFQAILAQSRPGIVHTHVIDGFSASIWRRARRLGVPVMHTAHDYHLLCPRAFLLTRNWKLCTHPALPCRTYRAWHLHTALDVDLFVSPSQFLLDKHREAGLSAPRAAVVRNGIPHPPPRLERSPATPDAGMRFLLLCRLTEEKGVRVVLDAVRMLPSDLRFELTVAGRGPLEPVARAAAEADPRIRFAGFVQGEEKHALLSQADHLLLPSLWYENAPVAVVEAAAYGIGVIGSRIGGIPELVTEGRTGLLSQPGDAAGLAAIMQGLASGAVALHGLAEEAAAVTARHGIGTMVDAYLEHYAALQLARTSVQTAMAIRSNAAAA
ncbi:MAG TPA: glycosyltransferase family 4 protein [Acetobacteraceae bacterium]|nr:glycosyltransferase family 4 protein [Acetobacteraceae bacterium]